MTYALVLLALGVVGVVGAVAAGAVSGGLPPATRERASTPLPGDRVGRLEVRDVDAVRFTTALRGYRMDEVDAAMERMRTELAARDAELAELYGLSAPEAPGPGAGAEPGHPDLQPVPEPTAAPARPGSRRAARGA